MKLLLKTHKPFAQNKITVWTISANKQSGLDYCVWPDGTTCEANDLCEYAWKSDDFIRIPFDTAEWHRVDEELNS